MSFCNVKKAISESDALIFPLPSIRTDGSLNTPFSNENILLDGDDIEIILKKPVFTTMKSRFLKAYPRLSDGEIFDYGASDDFAILNALPTAEGAIECAMREYEGTISGSKCLVTGFGRIGKISCSQACFTRSKCYRECKKAVRPCICKSIRLQCT